MKLKYNYFIFPWIVWGSLFLLAGCGNDDDNTCCDPANPECPNYDPCFGQSPTSADFKFLDQVGIGNNPEFREEPFFFGGNVKFSAVDTTADSYTWYLGTDTFFDITEITLDISDLPNGTYGASLVVEKSANLDCFPNDIGRDSLYQTFTKIDFCDALVLGHYRGLINNQTDSINIEVYLASPNSGEVCAFSSYPHFVNLFEQGDTLVAPPGALSYSKLYATGNGSGALKGALSIDVETMISLFEYRFGSQDYVFNGIKLD